MNTSKTPSKKLQTPIQSNTSIKVSEKTQMKSQAKSIEELYKMKSPEQHVLDVPDTYIGGIKEDMTDMWVFDEESQRIAIKNIAYNPGLYKIFDEVLVNAFDHTIRDKTTKTIAVNINQETGEISCYNDGKESIPVEIHKETKVYVPEMIFGMLRTSGNYDQLGKIVGGKNGYGSKLANLFSTYFFVEILDAIRHLKYQQVFTNNMKRKEPKITESLEDQSYVLIKFIPDFARFGCIGWTDGMVSLLKKRVYDIATNSHAKVQVSLNDNVINLTKFEDYCQLYYEDDDISKFIYEEYDNRKLEPVARWRVGAMFDPTNGYRHISYVNGICTYQGGKHVDHVVNQIVEAIADHIRKSNKNIVVKNSQIKDNLTFFISSVIEDPSFQSQTKDYLNTPIKNFGSRYEVSEKFIKDLCKTGVIDEVVNFAKLKAMAELKKMDGKKVNNLRGLEKLTDAHWAGTIKSKQCRLILTEGDSAKTFALEGCEIIGKEKFGVFPLRGKLLNVREATAKQLVENEEIKSIIKILGLKTNKKYNDVNELRYGGIIILTDQDLDGSHIKGLIMNFVHFFWPSLMKIDGFIQSMATPILKAFKNSDIKKKDPQIFYTLKDYDDWKTTIGSGIKNWNVKYYKGLGTSDKNEARRAFTDFDQKVITYIWDLKDHPLIEMEEEDQEEFDESDTQEPVSEKSASTKSKSAAEDTTDSDKVDKKSQSYNAITLAFAKTRTNDRKRWLEKYNPDKILDTKAQQVPYIDFVNLDLIHFSNYDNIRSIPSICDGHKPSQRKIMYGAFKRKLWKEELKVAQFGGYVAEHSAYHHGEVSIQSTIIGMAHDFVGTNNINLLVPAGCFGSRRLGGKDAASPRYIYTKLTSVTREIYREEDEATYTYVDDDGTKVEPIHYAPIIPMILVNGSKGIGTGFSTTIPCYKPLDLLMNIRNLLKGKAITKLVPWYNNFNGKIIKTDTYTYDCIGVYNIINSNSLIITEIPIEVWIESYFNFLESMVLEDPKKPEADKILSNVINNSGSNKVNITVQFLPEFSRL